MQRSFISIIDPFVTWEFCRKTHFEAIFNSLALFLNLPTKLFTGGTLHGLLIPDRTISLRSSGTHKKQNFEIVFGFKSDTAILTGHV